MNLLKKNILKAGIRMKICKISIYLFLSLFAFQAQGEELNLSLDKNTMTEGDTLHLTLSYNGNSGENPDLSALQQDFQIVSNLVSKQINYINGSLNQIKNWTIGLKPLKAGKITIKPVRLGNLSSNYAEVEIKPVTDVAFVPDSKENTNSPYFQIEQQINTTSPYVGQQVNLMVTLYDSLGLSDGAFNISETAQKEWTIVPLTDKPLIKQEVINGKRMNVLRYMFAAFPQKSGSLTVPQIMFDGYYIKDVGFEMPHFDDDLMMFGVDFRNAFGQKVPVKMRAKAEKINVKPIPAGINSQAWLPLENLEIKSEWGKHSNLKTGDAFSRKVKITATGIQENSLPPFEFPEMQGFKQYPEQPITSEKVINGRIVTTAEINTVYIPEKSGDYLFPPLEIEWFNIKTNHFEKAVVPAEKITVLPDYNTPPPLSPVAQPATTPAVSPVSGDALESNAPPSASKGYFSGITQKNIILYGFILLIALLFLGLKLFKPNNARKVLYNQVTKAIRKHDYQSAKNALLKWAAVKFGTDDVTNFNKIADLANDTGFAEQLAALNKCLYSDSDEVFNEGKFIDIFKKVDKNKINIHKNKAVLPNLYD